MAGRRKAAPDAPTLGNSLIASALRYNGKMPRVYTGAKEWQREAYRHYSICGEARFAANYFGHAVGKAVLEAVARDGSGVVKPAKSAQAALEALFNGPEGQSQMMTAIGMHLTVGGECYLIGRTLTETDERTGGDIWEIVSALEIAVSGSRWSLKRGEGLTDIPLDDDDVVIRIWRPHPADRMQADSPFRSLLPVLNEIEWLTKHIFAQASSRLASAGILFLPEGMDFPPPPETAEGNEPANNASVFMQVLAQTMEAALAGDGSAAEKVPIVVTAPDEAIDKARLMHFWSDLDAASQEMRNGAIMRFALGMDLPPEMVLGMGANPGTGGGTSNGVSHWGAWQIEEATIKMHVEPMLELICAALTVGYLRIQTEGDEFLRANTAALRLRPDRSREAIELFDRGVLSEAAMLREVGFQPDDVAQDEERKTWLIRKVASGSATPEQVGAALRLLGVDVPSAVDAPVPQESTREARPTPTLIEHPDRPRTPEAAALLSACDALVFRALERAGNRLRQSVGAPPKCRSFETHTLVKANGSAAKVLIDAFDSAEYVLDGIASATEVVPVLEAYCTTLMGEQSRHERHRLESWLLQAEVLA